MYRQESENQTSNWEPVTTRNTNHNAIIFKAGRAAVEQYRVLRGAVAAVPASVIDDFQRQCLWTALLPLWAEVVCPHSNVLAHNVCCAL